MNIKLLKKLIEFKTVSGNDIEFDNCIFYIKDYLKNSNLNILEYKFANKKSLVIKNTDSNDLDIIFCGHLDVVPGNRELFTPIITNKKIYGRGSFDMRGHDFVMIEIMKNLYTFKTEYKVGLFLTSDEEEGGFLGTNKLLNELNYNTKLAIVPDGGNNFKLVTEEKGVLQLELTYYGKSSHASRPFDGDNAIVHLINVYEKLKEKYPLPKNELDYRTSINLSSLVGRDAINKVCSSAIMELDIRHILEDKKESIIEFIKNIDSKVNINILAKGIEFVYLENDLSKKYISSCEKVLNKKIELFKCESSSDARFFYEKGISTIIMNAIGGNMHGDEEFVDLKSLEILYKIYIDFLES